MKTLNELKKSNRTLIPLKLHFLEILEYQYCLYSGMVYDPSGNKAQVFFTDKFVTIDEVITKAKEYDNEEYKRYVKEKLEE